MTPTPTTRRSKQRARCAGCGALFLAELRDSRFHLCEHLVHHSDCRASYIDPHCKDNPTLVHIAGWLVIRDSIHAWNVYGGRWSVCGCTRFGERMTFEKFDRAGLARQRATELRGDQ